MNDPDPNCPDCFGIGAVETGGDEAHTRFSVACICTAPDDRHHSGFDPSRDDIARLREIGALVASIRLPDEALVVVSVGARCPDYDCHEGSVEATVRIGGEVATAGAAGTDLATALLLARGKAKRQIEAREKKRASDSDRNPEGEKPQALSAEHESAGPKGIAQPSQSGEHS